MKALLATCAFLLLATASFCQELSEIPLPPNGDAEKAEVSQWIGLVHISLAYHSPRIHHPANNDRTGHIWGELVKYGMFDDGFGPSRKTPWRAGANETTTITVSHDVKVAGKDLKAGTYGLFLETAESGPWSWIFSSQSGWGSFQYDAKYDVLRVAVTPQDAPFTEFLTYGFDERQPASAVAYLQWEKKRIPLKLEVPNVNELYVGQIRKNLLSWPGFNYQNWQSAAQFCADNKINLEEALVWADKAIKEPFRGAVLGHEDFSTLSTKAAVLSAMGHTDEADKLMENAMTLPGTDAVDIYRYGMQVLGEKRNSVAMKIFETSRRQHPAEKFWTSLGLARGYTAVGDKKNAIANWELVLANAPENLAGNKPRWQTALNNLKENK